MAQLNIICHGMMLFVETEEQLEILMPVIADHDYRVGAPHGLSCDPFPGELPSGVYDLSGVDISGSGLNALDPREHLLLHGDRFDVVRNEHICIQVPKPDRVRMFRRVRPHQGSTADLIFGSVPRETALGEPDFLHDVVALIYDEVGDGTEAAFGGGFSAIVTDRWPTNVDLYSQIGPGVHPEDTGSVERHETGINSLLRLRSSGEQPAFVLSKVGKARLEIPAGDGIGPCDMASLFELSHFVTDGTGCSPAFLLRR